MKITAAVLDRIGAEGPFSQTRPLRLAELELAEPRPGELLLRIDAAGLCHSDLSVVNGDRVVLAFLPACGQCPDCGAGQLVRGACAFWTWAKSRALGVGIPPH